MSDNKTATESQSAAPDVAPGVASEAPATLRETEPVHIDELVGEITEVTTGNLVPVVLWMLGYRVRSDLTGFTGTISGIHFDINGCVRAVVTPFTDEKGKLLDSELIDIQRLKIISPTQVAKPSKNFLELSVEDFDNGPSEVPGELLREAY